MRSAAEHLANLRANLGPDATIGEAARAYYEMAGPALLAAIDPDEVDEIEEPPDWWPALYGNSQGRLTQLRSWRYSWWLHAREKARLILPYRYHWVITPNQMNRGNPVNQDIINASGTLAMRNCAAGLYSGLMGSSRPWFKFGMAAAGDVDPPAHVAMWLDDATKRVLSVFANSNFYTLATQACEDVSTFNTAPMIIYEDAQTVIHCYLPCFGEYMLGKGGKFRHDTIYREYVMTTEQIVDFFGYANCPSQVQEQWRSGGASIDFERVIAHAIEPNFALSSRDRREKPISVLPGHFAFREVYWLRNEPDCRPLSLRGFVERPFIVLGWQFTSNDPYAHGPSDDALGSINQLQHQEIAKGTYIDHFVKPPMTAPPELRNQPSSTRPGDITYTTVDAAFKPAYQANPAGFGPLVEDMGKVENRLARIWHNDAFLAISQMEGIQPRERLELTYRMAEKIQLLGPVIENFEAELGHAVYRVASIMERRGMFLPKPPELRGPGSVKIVYTSQMKQLQNAAETAAIQAVAQFAGEMSEAALAAGKPPPARILDGDETLRRYGIAVGAPAAILLSPEKVAKADAARAQQQQAQMAVQATMPAVQAAEGLSRIPPSGGASALGQILGNQQAQPR